MRRLASLLVMTVAFSGMSTLPTMPALVVYIGCLMLLFRVRRPVDGSSMQPAARRRTTSHATH